jgi:sulfate adenylyltransferase subunit 2
VLERDGMLMMIDDDRIDLQPGEVIKKQMVRFRTLGCWPLTGAVESKRRRCRRLLKRCWSRPPASVRGA